jgi:MtrB/PioB family decaheme-associated outer membrane protein
MKTNKELFVVRKLTLAVQGALVAMLAIPLIAFAADDDVAALTHPTNSVEIGIGNTSKDSAKFGEYNGLNKSGADLIGNFSVRGGDAYNAHEGGSGVNRWEIKGTDLGTTSRELGGTVSNQGQWNLGIKYDELRHNISDTYQTPLQGSMGGNNFTLPSNFGVINTSYIDPNVKGGAQALTPTQLAAFHTEDVHSDRKNTSFTAGYNFDPQWGVKFDFNRLDQSGAKLMMASTDAATAASGPGGSTWGVEKMLMLMNPTNYKTDTFNLDINWKGDKSFLTAGYFGSFFRDKYNSLTFPNPYAALNATTPAMGDTSVPFPIDTLSTMPSNDFHQLNLSGGYTFTSATKVAGGLSYGRNTQNEDYPFAMLQVVPGTPGVTALPMGGGVPPQGSLNALVISTHADLKLTNQTSKDLMLSVGLKYNQRDNQTASNTYNFIDLGNKNRTSVNTPMSNRKTQLEFAGDYRLNQSNRLHLAYEYEAIKRWCNNSLANTAQGPVPLYPYTDSSCVQIPASKENKLLAGYKLNASEAVHFNAGYSYAKRKSDVNDTFYNPMQALVEGFEFPGYRAFFDASRTEQLVKAGVNWEANDKLSLGLNGRYVDDRYDDSPLGVQKGNTWSANLDATYSYIENGSISAYMTQEHSQRDLTNEQRATTANATRLAVLAGSTWSNKLHDNDSTLGLGVKQGGLMSGKLVLAGDLTYSLGKTGYDTQLNYTGTTLTPNFWTCSSTGLLSCGSTPDIKSELLILKITGNYQVDKASKVALGYMFQKLKSDDYYYNFYQNGYTGTGNLPTNQQSGSYAVNVVTVSYSFMF